MIGSYAKKVALALMLALFFMTQVAHGQGRYMVLSGEFVSPAYEGWWPNDDGSYKLFFGYMNSNWEEELDVAIGPDNYFSIVGEAALDNLEIEDYDFAIADQGQPTHFYPRRNPFLFTIDVPSDFGTNEMVWTLRTKNHVARAFASLMPDYRINPQVISTEVGGSFGSLDDRLRTNIPPELRLDGEAFRTARVGEPLDLSVEAHDPDNLPERRPGLGGIGASPDQIYRTPQSIVVMSGPGLRFSWSIYRGPAKYAKFEPAQFKTYTDSRAYANSPWSPPYIVPEVPEGNRWTSTVTFDRPGEYVLRGIASDGSMFSYQNVNVTVTR